MKQEVNAPCGSGWRGDTAYARAFAGASARSAPIRALGTGRVSGSRLLGRPPQKPPPLVDRVPAITRRIEYVVRQRRTVECLSQPGEIEHLDPLIFTGRDTPIALGGVEGFE